MNAKNFAKREFVCPSDGCNTHLFLTVDLNSDPISPDARAFHKTTRCPKCGAIVEYTYSLDIHVVEVKGVRRAK